MTKYLTNITKAQIAELPIVTTTGDIVVVKTDKEADYIVSQLMQETVLGFDTETRPSFVKDVRYKVSLLQLATQDTCYLFRLNFIQEHEGLKKILESSEIKKIGLSVHDDFMSLNKWMRVCPKNFIELQKYVGAFGIEEKSLQKIYAIVFSEKISKRQQLSNWEAPILSPQQQTYAAIDAFACREIYLELQKQVFAF
ncbi:MAG: 3'-5' exonuclease domain-containing protein 2 [Paludibacteraceae bacterium]|nr:3'-5' exonuclease domain-containing protein 2 [Paludibacteraceae bacterium]